jgi:hypothetical protein
MTTSINNSFTNCLFIKRAYCFLAMKMIVLIGLFCSPLITTGQVSQKGIVYELSSGNKPITGVSIIVQGSSISTSDNNGQFILVFQKKRGGEPVFIDQLYKKGYEVVNSEDVQNWVFSPSNVFTIVMCKEGLLAESRRKFYKIGEDYYETEYNKSLKEFKRQMESNQISGQQYQVSVNEANEQLKKKRMELDYYADKFSRINKDNLNDVDKQALQLLEAGKIEEAIKVYEDAKILEKFLMKLATRDTANYNIVAITPLLLNQVELLLQKGGMPEIMKADTILCAIANSDTANFNVVYKYASFLMQENQYAKAFHWYKTSLIASKTEEQKNQVLIDLKNLYLKIEDPVIVQGYKNQIESLTK